MIANLNKTVEVENSLPKAVLAAEKIVSSNVDQIEELSKDSRANSDDDSSDRENHVGKQ
jgi:hypothetical protein